MKRTYQTRKTLNPESNYGISRANDHFKESLNTYSEKTDIDYEIKSRQDEINSYFETTYGSHIRFLLYVYTTQQIVDQSRFVENLLTF